MARKRYSDKDALKILREVDVHLHDGLDVVSAYQTAVISSHIPRCQPQLRIQTMLDQMLAKEKWHGKDECGATGQVFRGLWHPSGTIDRIQCSLINFGIRRRSNNFAR